MIQAAVLVFSYFAGDKRRVFLYKETHVVDIIMMVCEVLLVLLVCFLAIRKKKFLILPLSIIPTGIALAVEITEIAPAGFSHVLVDRLSLMMCVLIAVIGGLIVVYATGYMKGYHEHHYEVEDRKKLFISLLFVFLGAMFGLVLSNSLLWMFFFWEITSVCSFLLIGYTKSDEAVANSFKALWMNLLGGFGFSLAILYIASVYSTVSLAEFTSYDNVIMLPVMFLVFAAMTKSAQLPFTGWLLGAMVAPTPSSALLHSATMVKAGCFLLLRLSPVMSGNLVGEFTAVLGAFTFFMASLLAISQSDGKKVLAYSTVSNLGLIVACAGVGTPGTVWAAMFLILFHAVTKSMLFQCVGAIENSSHSRDIEDMAGLTVRLKKLAAIMILGIMGMYLAPFGMLIFKWAALKAFVDSSNFNVFLVLVIAFGSATTLYYWTKWLCKLVSYNSECVPLNDITEKGQYLSMYIHGIFVVVFCMAFPFISDHYIGRYVADVFGESVSFISRGNQLLMFILVLLLFIVPLSVFLIERKMKKKIVPSYLAGVNRQGGRAFMDSHGDERHLELANWYLEDYFGEKKLLKPSVITAALFLTFAIISMFILTLI